MNKAKLSDRIAWVMTLTSLISVIMFFFSSVFQVSSIFQGTLLGGTFMALSFMGLGVSAITSEYEDRLAKGKTMMRLINDDSEYGMDG